MMTRYLCSFLIILLVLCAPVRFEKSDSMYNILTSSSIIQHKTLYLDSYCHKEISCDNNFRILKKQNHYLYSFPLGTSFFSIPVVLITEAFNINPVKYGIYIQRLLTCICLVLTYICMLKISDTYMSCKNSTFLSSFFFLCTGLISTLGSALWSHDMAILFCFLAILATLRNLNFFIIAFFIFAAYICRPTFSVFGFYLICYWFLSDFKKSIKISLSLIILLIIFSAYTSPFYGQILPPYYMPKRLSGNDFFTALFGHLFSPSRGLFVFSPFIFLYLFLFNWGKTKNKITFILGAMWPITHLMVVSKFPDWWGGYSFGPRLMTDCLPGIFLFMATTWKETNIRNFIFISALIFSFYVNSYKGRFDIDAAINWNKTHLPGNPGDDTKSLFDWKNSQLLN